MYSAATIEAAFVVLEDAKRATLLASRRRAPRVVLRHPRRTTRPLPMTATTSRRPSPSLPNALHDRSHSTILATVRSDAIRRYRDVEAAPHPWPALASAHAGRLVEKDELERSSRSSATRGSSVSPAPARRGPDPAGRVTPTRSRSRRRAYELPFVDFDVADIDCAQPGSCARRRARLWALPISGPVTELPPRHRGPGTVLSPTSSAACGARPRFAVVARTPSSGRSRSCTASRFRPSRRPEPRERRRLIVMSSSSEDATDAIGSASTTPGRRPTWPPLGALLLRDGLVTDDELEAALAQQRSLPACDWARSSPARASSRGRRGAAGPEQYELPFYELDRVEIDPRSCAAAEELA